MGRSSLAIGYSDPPWRASGGWGIIRFGQMADFSFPYESEMLLEYRGNRSPSNYNLHAILYDEAK